MSLPTALLEPGRFIFLYGAATPRADADGDHIQRAASRLAERVQRLEPDGLIVYDVQDESGRTGEPRPFPFLPTLESRIYSRLLTQATGRPVITYKCVARLSEAEWAAWLDEAKAYDICCLSVVGQAAAGNDTSGTPLLRAMEMAAAHPHGFTLGGVVIPERHRPERSESARLLQKAASGCGFFVSQAVYSAGATIRLCRDYYRDCEAQGIPPRRIILTFTPCGRPETLRFIKWLGVAVPEEVERTILSSGAPLTESVRVCADSLRRVLEAGASRLIPLGVNVESVSIRKEEIAATVDLFHALRDVVRQFT
jgi:5,10-methylenetetrahydrofolate reductase